MKDEPTPATTPPIDWTGISIQTLTCACDTTWRSRAKFVGALGRVVALVGCPGCGANDQIRRAESDPETWDLHA